MSPSDIFYIVVGLLVGTLIVISTIGYVIGVAINTVEKEENDVLRDRLGCSPPPTK